MVQRGGGEGVYWKTSHRTNFHAPLWNSTTEWNDNNDNIDETKKFPCQPGFSLLFLHFPPARWVSAIIRRVVRTVNSGYVTIANLSSNCWKFKMLNKIARSSVSTISYLNSITNP